MPQVLQGWADTQSKYPNAKLVTSSLDDFAALLADKRRRDIQRSSRRIRKNNNNNKEISRNRKTPVEDGGDDALAAASATWALPVVANAELGSTWIFGLSSDATKLAWYRAAARARAEFLQANPVRERMNGDGG